MENRKQSRSRKKKLPQFLNWFHQLWKIDQTDDHLITEAPPVTVREIFSRFWPYVRSYRLWIIVSFVLIALLPVVQSATIWLTQLFIDKVLVPQDVTPLYWIVLAYVGFTMLQGVLYFSSTYLSHWVGESFVLTLREKLYEHLQSLSLNFFEGRKLGDIISRVTGDITSIERLVVSGATSAISYACQLVVFVGMLFFMHWQLALISLVIVPLFYMVTRFFSRRIKMASRERTRRVGAINAVTEESFSNVALMQAYNQENIERERFGLQNNRSFKAKMLKVRLKAAFTPVVIMIETGGTVVVMAVGAWFLMNGNLTLGTLIAFLTLLGKLYSPIRGLSKLLNTIYSASASAERVIEFLEEEPMVKESAYPVSLPSGRIEFANVSFSYPGKQRKILSNVSFRVEPGESVALVGSSGVGKSTIVKLLMRFYDPTSGRILLDGNNLKGITLQSVRDNIAVLFQESLIFDGTIRDNIAYGKQNATETEIIQAAKLADAHKFIESLPKGYETLVGQKGRNLSGGQQQRIAIARAMIRNAPILVLDEPTEGLDTSSQQRIMEPLRRLISSKATLMITHNIFTASAADRIIVLENGEVLEHGTHEELLRRNGKYAELYYLQLGDEESQPMDLSDVRNIKTVSKKEVIQS